MLANIRFMWMTDAWMDRLRLGACWIVRPISLSASLEVMIPRLWNISMLIQLMQSVLQGFAIISIGPWQKGFATVLQNLMSRIRSTQNNPRSSAFGLYVFFFLTSASVVEGVCQTSRNTSGLRRQFFGHVCHTSVLSGASGFRIESGRRYCMASLQRAHFRPYC